MILIVDSHCVAETRKIEGEKISKSANEGRPTTSEFSFVEIPFVRDINIFVNCAFWQQKDCRFDGETNLNSLSSGKVAVSAAAASAFQCRGWRAWIELTTISCIPSDDSN